jgi:predicted nucleic acid-binding protein
MRIIVSDTSCMIDLRKVELLEELLRLPYTFVMPDTLFEDELLSLTAAEKKRLRKSGLEVRALPGPQVERAARYFNRHRRLKLNDCFALVLAEETEDSMLLTGDGLLRRIAEDRGLEARGVLWAIDELEVHKVVSPHCLHEALLQLYEDTLVFLPEGEVLRRMRRLAKLI